MRKLVYVSVALGLVACADEKKTEVAAAAAEAPKEEAAAAGVDVEGLKAKLATIVVAMRDKDVVARRAACLEAVPELESMLVASSHDKKVAAVGTDLLPLCPEITETKKLMEKLANPPPSIQLSAAYAQFTHSDLAKSFKQVKRIAKKKQDPAPLCSEIRVLTDHLGSKKAKKTKKLVKKASKFCNGYAHLASAQFHMRVVERAMAEEATAALVESCVHGVKQLAEAPAGKLHDKLDAEAKERCVEAVALQGMLRSGAS